MPDSFLITPQKKNDLRIDNQTLRMRGEWMDVKKILVIILALLFLALNGCAKEEKPKDMEQQNQAVLYENTELGLRVLKTQNWMIDEEPTTKQFNITFKNDYSKAIITVISNEKSFEEIKRELQTGAGEVSVLKETSDYLAFKSEREESIRTDIYISQRGTHTYIVTFMTPLKDYESNQESIEAFYKNVEIFDK